MVITYAFMLKYFILNLIYEIIAYHYNLCVATVIDELRQLSCYYHYKLIIIIIKLIKVHVAVAEQFHKLYSSTQHFCKLL